MTKAVINGKTYNTETATLLCNHDNSESTSDFRHRRCDLYKTKKGRFFLEGFGGALSVFGEPYGQNGWIGGDGIRVVTEEEALEIAEREMGADDIAMHFDVEEA